jgi:hypothetical protein
MFILQHLKSPDGLVQMDGQMNPVIRQPKDEATDPRAKSLEVQAPLRLLSELDNYLPHDIRLEDFSGQVPKHGLSGRTHYPGVVGHCKPHSLI